MTHTHSQQPSQNIITLFTARCQPRTFPPSSPAAAPGQRSDVAGRERSQERGRPPVRAGDTGPLPPPSPLRARLPEPPARPRRPWGSEPAPGGAAEHRRQPPRPAAVPFPSAPAERDGGNVPGSGLPGHERGCPSGPPSATHRRHPRRPLRPCWSRRQGAPQRPRLREARGSLHPLGAFLGGCSSSSSSSSACPAPSLSAQPCLSPGGSHRLGPAARPSHVTGGGGKAGPAGSLPPPPAASPPQGAAARPPCPLRAEGPPSCLLPLWVFPAGLAWRS